MQLGVCMDLQKIESKNNLIAFIRENIWSRFWLFKPKHGWINGYVALPSTHPFYGLDYDEIDQHVDVHGGLTYSQSYVHENETYWLIGFDTMNSFDNPEYNNKEYVTNETLNLLKQCLEFK